MGCYPPLGVRYGGIISRLMTRTDELRKGRSRDGPGPTPQSVEDNILGRVSGPCSFRSAVVRNKDPAAAPLKRARPLRHRGIGCWVSLPQSHDSVGHLPRRKRRRHPSVLPTTRAHHRNSGECRSSIAWISVACPDVVSEGGAGNADGDYVALDPDGREAREVGAAVAGDDTAADRSIGKAMNQAESCMSGRFGATLATT